MSIAFAGRGPQQDWVLENASWILGLNPHNRFGIAVEALPEIDESVLPKRQNRLACAGVNLLNEVIHRKDKPAILPVFAFPVGDAASRQAGKIVVDPNLLPRGGVQRH